MTESVSPTRFAHLIYTSDQQGIGVKDSRGDWLPEESAAVRQFISPSLGFGVDIPSNYSPGRDEPLPRRVVWTSAGVHGMALWHSVPVEADYTGRSGSVFAQCLLDREPWAHARVRPIDWWGSPDLQTPYFVSDYSTARLTLDDEPRPGDTLSTDSLYLYLASHGPLIRNLLDATYHAMHGGPPVILGMASQAAAALAIGVVSHVMSPRTARGLRFSLLETTGADGSSDSLAGALNRDLHIIVVPAHHFVDLRPDDRWLLLDEKQGRVGPETVGSRHSLDNGQELEVTAWSVLAWGVFEWGTSSDFERLDDVSAGLGDDDLDQAVPLAVMVAAERDAHDETLYAVAGEVLMEFGPGDPSRLTETARTAISGAISAVLGSSLDDARRAVARLRSDSSAQDWVVRAYLNRLAASPASVLGRLDLPARGLDITGDAIDDLVPRLRAALSEVPVLDHAAYLVRFMDHLIGLGFRSEGGGSHGVAQLRTLLSGDAVEGQILSGSHLAATGPVAEATLATFVRPVLTAAWRDGQEIPAPLEPTLYRWLYPQPPETERVDDGLHFSAVYTCLLDDRERDDRDTIRQELLLAMSERRALPLVSTWDRDRVLTELVTMAPLSDRLQEILGAFDPNALPEAVLVAWVLQEDFGLTERTFAIAALLAITPRTILGGTLHTLCSTDLEETVIAWDKRSLRMVCRAGNTILREVREGPLGPGIIGRLVAVAAIGNARIIAEGRDQEREPWADEIRSLDESLARWVRHGMLAAVDDLERLLIGAQVRTDFCHHLALIDAVASDHLDRSHGWPTVLRTFRVTDVDGVSVLRRALQAYLEVQDVEQLIQEVPAYVDGNPQLATSSERFVKVEKALVGHWRRCAGRERGLGRIFGRQSKRSSTERQEDT